MHKRFVMLLVLALAGTCYAAEWELGGAAGMMLYKNLTVTQGSNTANAGISNGLGAGAFLTQNSAKHLGGQLRYMMGFGDLKLSGANGEAKFSARTHTITYEILYYANKRVAKVRPYVAVGAGMKIFQGTGKEQVTQPLAQYALLTKTSQTTWVASFGAGVKGQLGRRTFVYFEVRDYLSPKPDKVIAPAPGAKISGMLHDITPMVGISIGF